MTDRHPHALTVRTVWPRDPDATQVIQHFPSERYVTEWLSAVNDARIPKVFLEVRWAEKPRFSSWIRNRRIVQHGTAAHRPDGEVTLAVLVNCQWMLQRLPAYRLEEEWTTTEGHVKSHVSHFQACSYSLLPRPGAVARRSLDLPRATVPSDSHRSVRRSSPRGPPRRPATKATS